MTARPKPAKSAVESPAGARAPVLALPWPKLAGIVAGLVLAGLVLGVLGAFMQAWTVRGGDIRWPVGAALSVTVLGAVAASAGLLLRSRLGTGLIAGGWVVSVLILISPRPEGDVIVAADGPGYGFLIGGAAALTLVSVVPYAGFGSDPSA